VSGLTAFVGVTALVVSGFLLLARLSQQAVDDIEEVDPGSPRTEHAPEADRPVGPPSASGSALPRQASERSAERRDTPPPGDLMDPSRTSGDPHTYRTSPARERPEALGGAGTMSPGALLANVALTQGLFGGLLAAAAWYFGVPGSALGLWGGVEGPLAVGVGVAFGVVLWVGNEVASALADAAGAAYDEELRTLLAPQTAGGWLVLLGATLPIIALVEEFLFRAAAIGVTAAAFPVSPWALAVVSSGAFALGHGAQGRVGVVVTGALGFALAAGFVFTGSALVVVVAHYLVNALEFGLHEGLGLPDPVWS
jgi:membrane protease YdiL (CAAX protease family)